jgi:phospholipid/cholesterol/gamma-HCH transport system substrate-binding protein
MKKNAMEMIVGLFFVLGLGAIFILTFRVASLSGAAPGQAYAVSAVFDNIGGLKQGSAVTLAGMRIGRVQDIQMLRESFQAKVLMEIDQRYDNIPADSSATILTAGLLGEQYIGLDPGGDTQVLADGDSIDLTQSALILERLVGQFVSAQSSDALSAKAVAR